MIINAEDWLQEDNLMLLECWSRDGYTLTDIATRIGITFERLRQWRKRYPEIDKALKQGREIIDYKVENALLKSALGYPTREVKVTTVIRRGQVIETIKETTDKEQSPNVSAIQCWLFNRLPDKWKKNRDNIIDLDDKDTSIQVTVLRASNNETEQSKQGESWSNSVNQSVVIRNKTEEEIEAEKKAKQAVPEDEHATKVTYSEEDSTEDLDYWPDDWEDEE